MTSIIALIVSIIGCLIMGFCSSIMVEIITIALIITLIGLGLTIYSLVKKDYNKICVIISFIVCTISLFIRSLF